MERHKALSEALAQSPGNVSLLLLHAQACFDEMHLTKARASFEKILALEPDQAQAQLGIARILLVQGDISGAAVRTERVLQKDQQNAAAHVVMSQIHLMEGDRERALEAARRAVEADSDITNVALEAGLGIRLKDLLQKTDYPVCPADNWNDPEEDFSQLLRLSSSDSFDSRPPDEGWDPEMHFRPGDADRSDVTFADVGGMDELKDEFRRRIIHPLQHPELYKTYGRKAGGGILVYGPPGCGKSLMLRAIAGETNCHCIAVGLHEIIDPYAGSSERNLHDVFAEARTHESCVLVFDEIEALATDRRKLRESQTRNLVNQFLSEMDGLLNSKSRLFIVGATNAPWQIDPAFCRPGRFDQSLFVPPPDKAGRAQIIGILAKERPIHNLNAQALAEVTEGFTGADLSWVFDRAADISITETLRHAKPMPMSMDVLLEVASLHQPTSQDWMEGVRPHVKRSPKSSIFGDLRKFLAASPRH